MLPWLLNDTVSLNSPFTALSGTPRELNIVDTSVVQLSIHVQTFPLHIVDTSKAIIKFRSQAGTLMSLAIVDTSVVSLTYTLNPGTFINEFATITSQSMAMLVIGIYVPPEDLTNLGLDTFIGGLPDSLVNDVNIQAIGMALDDRMLQVLPIIDRVRVLCNIPNQSEATLDWIAFQWGVPFYYIANRQPNTSQRIALKQTLIGNAFFILKKLGTPALIQQVLNWLFPQYNLVMQEWQQYGGTANHFRLLSPTGIINDPVVLADIGNALFSTIRASQAFDGIVASVTPPTPTLGTYYIGLSGYFEINIVAPIAA